MLTLPLRAALAVVALSLAARGESVQIRVLATTDLHGNIYPYDYYTAKPAPRGLAKIATRIAQERAANANTILIDCGDTIQGSPLEFVHQAAVRAGSAEPDPMMAVMNRLGYVSMTVGNHEFDRGMAALNTARKQAKFPWLSANIAGFTPYTIPTVAGVRVAIIGITTAQASSLDAARKAITSLRQRNLADVILIAAHSGLDRDPKSGSLRAGDLPNENVAFQLAGLPGVDAVIFGHTHSELAEYRVGDVLLLQPANWGMSLGEMDFGLDHVGQKWMITSKSSRVIPVSDATPPDPAILALTRPYHDAAERYLEKPVAQMAVTLDMAKARMEDTALVDAIQIVQLAAAKADVSFASAFDLGVKMGPGKVTVRQLAALYPYDNTLYAIAGTGKMVRDALENAARFYGSSDMAGYNYDMAEGVDYEIDLRHPAGSRIVNLNYHGKPLADSQPLRIAVNNYRAGGNGGYSMFRGAKILWRSPGEIREMLIEYFTAHGSLPTAPDHNWRIIPSTIDVEK